MARIVVPFDGGPSSAHALALACGTVAEPIDVVEAIYVVRVPPQLPIGADLPAARSRAWDRLARAETVATGYRARLTTLLVMARAVGPGIVAAAEGADLLLLGRRDRRFAARLRGYRTLRHVLAHAPCQVLVVPVPATGRADMGDNPFLLSPPGAPDPRSGAVLLFPVSRAHGGAGGERAVSRVLSLPSSDRGDDARWVRDVTRDG
jgi:nucleotide-binding universal stress UspA family protein